MRRVTRLQGTWMRRAGRKRVREQRGGSPEHPWRGWMGGVMDTRRRGRNDGVARGNAAGGVCRRRMLISSMKLCHGAAGILWFGVHASACFRKQTML